MAVAGGTGPRPFQGVWSDPSRISQVISESGYILRYECGQVVADQLAAAVGENRRAFAQACPLLLVAACGEPSDAPTLWKHAAEDRDAGGTGRIAARDGGFQIGCEETGTWRGVVGNGPQTVRSRLPARAKRWNWPLSWTSFSQDQGNAPTACAKGGVGLSASLIRGGKTEIPV